MRESFDSADCHDLRRIKNHGAESKARCRQKQRGKLCFPTSDQCKRCKKTTIPSEDSNIVYQALKEAASKVFAVDNNQFISVLYEALPMEGLDTRTELQVPMQFALIEHGIGRSRIRR